ncbi:MAG: hypothetical protein RSA61_03005 [Acidaminococcaceae bacterium]
MKSYYILILWFLLVFVVPRMLKTKQRPESSDEAILANENEPTTKAEDFWKKWGLEDYAPKEADTEEVIITPVLPEVVDVPAELVVPSSPKKPRLQFGKTHLRQGMIMAEVFGKPRALNPYQEEK